ncbi:hypothetical protein GOV05_05210 [Candidatus Woesearchaeota archaeon]|nr:hypothetical protein [Candidatus Woesearchaeota archaeon]
MLEDMIRRFKLGKKICDEAVQDYISEKRGEPTEYLPQIHETRVDGINIKTDQLEGLGYLTGVIINSFKQPRTMYKIFTTKD